MWKLSKEKEITEKHIKVLHKLFFQAIDEKNAGKYRRRNVTSSGSQYNARISAPAELKGTMKAFIAELPVKRQNFHPVVFAALLHKELVLIDPFVDGNGRVARLIINLALMRAGFPITIIPPILQSEYIQALEKAHVDDRGFLQFIAEQVLQTQWDYIRLLRI